MPLDAVVEVETRWPRIKGSTGIFFVRPDQWPSEPENHPSYYLMNHSQNPNVKMGVDAEGRLCWVCFFDGDDDYCHDRWLDNS